MFWILNEHKDGFTIRPTFTIVVWCCTHHKVLFTWNKGLRTNMLKIQGWPSLSMGLADLTQSGSGGPLWASYMQVEESSGCLRRLAGSFTKLKVPLKRLQPAFWGMERLCTCCVQNASGCIQRFSYNHNKQILLSVGFDIHIGFGNRSTADTEGQLYISL